MTKNASDEAAQRRKASADDQAKAAGSTTIRDDVEDTPTASEIIADDKNKVFGENPERQFQDRPLTADQAAVANGDKPVHEPAKTEGGQVKVGDRVLLHTSNPIGGQTINPALVIGFAPSGNANLRLEFLDGGRANPVGSEYGGVPQNAAQEERGNFWTWPETEDKPSKE